MERAATPPPYMPYVPVASQLLQPSAPLPPLPDLIHSGAPATLQTMQANAANTLNAADSNVTPGATDAPTKKPGFQHGWLVAGITCGVVGGGVLIVSAVAILAMTVPSVGNGISNLHPAGASAVNALTANAARSFFVLGVTTVGSLSVVVFAVGAIYYDVKGKPKLERDESELDAKIKTDRKVLKELHDSIYKTKHESVIAAGKEAQEQMRKVLLKLDFAIAGISTALEQCKQEIRTLEALPHRTEIQDAELLASKAQAQKLEDILKPTRETALQHKASDKAVQLLQDRIIILERERQNDKLLAAQTLDAVKDAQVGALQTKEREHNDAIDQVRLALSREIAEQKQRTKETYEEGLRAIQALVSASKLENADLTQRLVDVEQALRNANDLVDARSKELNSTKVLLANEQATNQQNALDILALQRGKQTAIDAATQALTVELRQEKAKSAKFDELAKLTTELDNVIGQIDDTKIARCNLKEKAELLTPLPQDATAEAKARRVNLEAKYNTVPLDESDINLQWDAQKKHYADLIAKRDEIQNKIARLTA